MTNPCFFSHFHQILGSAPISRTKYVLDPSVQSSSSYGQSYAPTPQTFGQQPQTFGVQPQTFGSQPSTYGTPFSQPFNQSVPQPMPTLPGQSTIMNPTQQPTTFTPGLPPIEVAQPAIQQNIQRNPTPPPGWNDPPVLKSARPVSIPFFFECCFFLSQFFEFDESL